MFLSKAFQTYFKKMGEVEGMKVLSTRVGGCAWWGGGTTVY